MGMGIALVLDQRALADPRIRLAQRHALLLRQPDQPFAGAMQQPGVGREHHILGLHRRVDGELGKVARPGRSRPGGHAQAFLDQRPQPLLAHPLPPAGQG